MLFGNAVMLTTLMTGSVQAVKGGGFAEQGDSPAAVMVSRLQRQERELDRTIGALAQVGTGLEEAKGRVDGAKAHQEALGRRIRELDAALEAQKVASVRSSSGLLTRVESWRASSYCSQALSEGTMSGAVRPLCCKRPA